MTIHILGSPALRVGACLGLLLGMASPSAAFAAALPVPTLAGGVGQTASDPPLGANDVIVQQVTSPAGVTWAVGTTTITATDGTTATRPLIFKGVGGTWRRQRIPDLPDLFNGPVANARLYGVTVASDESVWAIGDATAATETYLETPVVMHVVGRRWTLVPPPFVPASFEYNAGVSTFRALAGDRLWVAGARMPTSTTYTGLLSLWNGTGWVDRSAEVSGTIHNSMVGLSDTDIWMAGLKKKTISNREIPPVTLAHYDGTTWTDQPVPGTLMPGRKATLYVSGGIVYLTGTGVHGETVTYPLS